MLRMIQSVSAEQAKHYYTKGLDHEDYLSQGQELVGKWYGKCAQRLGLEGKVGKEAFYALSENRDPTTGGRLTPRTKDERTVGYDFVFNCSKSVSAMYVHTKDERIMGAVRQAVSETMQEMEAEIKTRVRKGGVEEDRTTGNMVWAEFAHKTARPVDGRPDPHLHVHCFVFNVTYDEVEGRMKAGQFRDLKRNASYFQAAFHVRMAENMKALGYRIEAREKSWEIEGVPQSVIDKYSRRRDQIEALAEELGITDAAEKDKLGATSREKKVKHSMEELATEWASRLTPEEKLAMDMARGRGGSKERGGDGLSSPAQQSLDHALTHAFERESVIASKDILGEALRHGVGKVKVEEIKAAFEADPRILHRVVNGEQRCSTWEVFAQEKRIVAFAKETRGTLDAIKSEPHKFRDARLNAEQQAAVSHVLESRDQITLICGGAGVGKTTLMREAIMAMNAKGYHVQPLAPTAEASRWVLREEAGFANANTVESFLTNTKTQKQLAGQVIWVDEGSLMSANMAERLFKVAKTNGCRIVISGDTAQHHSVERGDIMGLLAKHAGLPVAEVKTIIRQKKEYKEAVTAVREGRLEAAFSTLEQMGAIRESPDIDALHQQLAEDYVALRKAKKNVLIVSPQHQEIAAVTKAVRQKLRENGKLVGEEHKLTRLTNLQLTEAQRGDARSFAPGQIVQFIQNAPGFKRGERFTVRERAGDGVIVTDGSGVPRALPLKMSKHFALYKEEEIALAAGDKIRITQNRFAANGKRLNNGSLFDVARVEPGGDVHLSNGAVLPKGFGHLTHGYCVTSHASQSKTVNVPLIAQTSLSFNASSLEQIYVSLSRGDQGLRIYTDNLKELRERVARSNARGSAMDFAGAVPAEIQRGNIRDIPVEMRRAWRSWQRRQEKAKMREFLPEKSLQNGLKRGGRSRGHGLELSF